MRRAYLDVIGTLPRLDEVKAFLRNQPPNRRAALVDAFNALNTVNYGSYTSSIQSAYFGRPQSASAARQVQLGVRFDF